MEKRPFFTIPARSNLEFAVVRCNLRDADMALFSDFFSRFGTVTTGRTLAGLYLLSVENPVFPDELAPLPPMRLWKIEMTIRTPDQQNAIVCHIHSALSLWMEAQKLAYIERIRAAFLHMRAHPDDPAAAAYGACKNWLRVLPVCVARSDSQEKACEK